MSPIRLICRLLALLLVGALSLSAQDRSSYRWYFGERLGLDFNTTPPSILSDGKTQHIEGTSSVSDSATGDLVLYTDGNTLWNRRNEEIATNLNPGFFSSTQSALIVRQPGSKNIYHLFTTVAFESGIGGAGRHFVINTALNGGRGVVVARNVNLTPSTVAEKVTAARACNGIDYWVIYRRNQPDSAGFFAYRLSPAGIDPAPVVSRTGAVIMGPGSQANRGVLKVSPNGRLIACAKDMGPTELFDFDNLTGRITNPRVLSDGVLRYGVSFSPDGRWLYLNNGWTNPIADSIFRYDVTAADVASSRQHIGVVRGRSGFGFIELAPDGRMYMARNNTRFLAVVNNPNAINPADAGFDSTAVTLGSLGFWGLPNFPQDLFIPNFAGAEQTVCPGEPALLGVAAQPDKVYRWTPADGLDDPTLAQPTARVFSTTVYTVTATEKNGCSVTRQTTVNVRPRPPVRLSISGPSTICVGESIRLEAFIQGATRYTWQPGSLDGPQQVFRPTQTQKYLVSIVDTNGCTWVDSLTVRVNPLPDASIRTAGGISRDSVQICSGDVVVLSATQSMLSYRWSTGDRNSRISVSNAGTYKVDVTDSTGCSNSDSIVVVVLPSVVADAGRDTSICKGSDLRLLARGGTAYLWTPLEKALPLDRLDIADPIVQATEPGEFSYAVRVTGSNGCSGSDTVRVKVNDNPVAEIAPSLSDITLCPCGSITLQANDATSYEWSRDSLGQVVGSQRQLLVSQGGVYRVRITDANGCQGLSAPVIVRSPNQQIRVSVSAPDSAYAGDDVDVKLSADFGDTTLSSFCPAGNVNVFVAMGRHALGSQATIPAGQVSGDSRRLIMPIPSRDARGVYQYSLKYVATLGATDTSVIRIDSVTWDGCPIAVQVTNDTFRLAGVCTARGGKRLYLEAAPMKILVQPNPSSLESSIIIQATSELSGCSVYLCDVLGRVVATIHNGGIEKDHHEVRFDSSALPDGVYSIIVRTATNQMAMQWMEVRK